MSKVLKLDEKEIATIGLLIAVISNDYHRHIWDIMRNDKAGEIAKETWATIEKLINIRESYIKVDENIIKELIEEFGINKDEAKKFFNEHIEDLPEGSCTYCLSFRE